MITNTNYISSWKSKGLSAESIKWPTTSDILTPELNYYGTKIRVKFTGSSLKQSKISYTHGKVVHIYIVYELNKIYTKTTPTLVNCLFGAISLTKNTDFDKYKYSGYEIGFDRRGLYLLPIWTFGRNVIMLGVDMNSSVHVDDKGKDILILGKGPTQGLGEHSLTAEKIYSVNFTNNNENIV